MTFRLMVDKRALGFLNSLEAKDQRIIKDKLKILQDNPYPDPGGDNPYYALPALHLNVAGSPIQSGRGNLTLWLSAQDP